jgi:uncharacterized protein (TIGR02391 family)
MNLVDLLPDAEVLLALEPDELGLHILQVLGSWAPHMQQQLQPDTFVNTVLGHPQTPIQGPYPISKHEEIREAIREAWFWLIGNALLLPSPPYRSGGDIVVLSRRGRRLAKEADPRRALSARRLPREVLHPKIREDVWQFFHRGKYDTAVFEAMKAVEVAVRAAAGLSASDIGAALMRDAFNPQKGPLTDFTVDDRNEREARAHLFAGVIGSYKNPHSHRNVALDDPDEAAEIIMLANHLLRITDARAAARSASGNTSTPTHRPGKTHLRAVQRPW